MAPSQRYECPECGERSISYTPISYVSSIAECSECGYSETFP